MQTMKRILFILVIFHCSLLISHAGGTTPVILTAGQSNADGRVPLEDLPEYISFKYCQWSYGSGDYLRATGDFQPFSPFVGRTDLGHRWGFDAVVYYLLEQQWQSPFYVIKQTMGGTAIDTGCAESTHGWFWSADEKTLNGEKSLLSAFTRQIDECIKKLPEDYDFKVLLWHQGESDMKRQKNYHDNLQAVVQYLRQHLVKVTGQEKYARLPVICGTFASGSRQRPPKVVEALLQLEREDPDFHVVDASDLTLQGDRIHFDARGAEMLGLRVYELMKELEIAR